MVLATLAVAGCGGGGTHTASVAAPGAVAAVRRFVAQSRRICAGVGAQEQPLKARKQALQGQSSAAAATAFAALARQAAAIARGAEEQLAALPRPPTDAPAIGRLVHAYSVEADDAGEIASAVANRESGLGEAASDALAKLVRQNLASASRLGMGECFTLE
jgi:hypothetical protein